MEFQGKDPQIMYSMKTHQPSSLNKHNQTNFTKLILAIKAKLKLIHFLLNDEINQLPSCSYCCRFPVTHTTANFQFMLVLPDFRLRFHKVLFANFRLSEWGIWNRWRFSPSFLTILGLHLSPWPRFTVIGFNSFLPYNQTADSNIWSDGLKPPGLLPIFLKLQSFCHWYQESAFLTLLY